MNNINVLMLTSDTEYGKTLGILISNANSEFCISVKSLENNTKTVFDIISDSDYDLYLIEGYETQFCDSFKDKIVILKDKETSYIEEQHHIETANKNWSIYKYSSVNEIISNLNLIYSINTGKKRIIKKSHDTYLMGFYSASGGVGKTSIAISTARELCRYHDKRILYINFDSISETKLYLDEVIHNRTICDYLYYLIEKKDRVLYENLEHFTHRDNFGVSYFLNTEGKNDLKQLNEEDWIFFIKTICESLKYDYIILDLSSDLNRDTINILQACSSIVLIDEDSFISKYKTQRLEYSMKCINSSFTDKNIIKVTNKFVGTTTDVYDLKGQSVAGGTILINKDDNSFSFYDEHIKININNDFGIGIKKIADELLVTAMD